MIRVLIVEDSPVTQMFLAHMLDSDPEIEVVGIARDGEEAVAISKELKPHVITMDINMPKMDGYQAAGKIMETNPTPIAMVSANYEPKEVVKVFRALEAGAVTIMKKPAGIGHPDYEAGKDDLLQTVRLLSKVKVARKRRDQTAKPIKPIKPKNDIKIVAIGASTGGPMAIQTILSNISSDYPLPILIVQHIADGFVQGFTDWLVRSTGFSVHVASQGDVLLPGHVYVAPDYFHMGVGYDARIVLSSEEPINSMRPSVAFLLRSVADVFRANAVGILLTGMGKDGAVELKYMQESGAVTIAQNEESCVVFGIPKEAIDINAADYVLHPKGIARVLIDLLSGAGKEQEEWTI